MSSWAYKDNTRINSITAEEAAKQNHSIDYYCPNTSCSAIMRISHCDGTHIPRFRARPSYPHIEGCLYGKSYFQKNDFDEDLFDFDEVIQSLMTFIPSSSSFTKGASTATPRSSLKTMNKLHEIYSYFKSESPTRQYNGVEIIQMLADERSAYFYTKGIIGSKIVEGKFWRFDSKTEPHKYIFLQYPFSNRKHAVALAFVNEDLYHDLLSSMLNNRDKHIVVAGNFCLQKINNAGYWATEINSKKQILIL